MQKRGISEAPDFCSVLVREGAAERLNRPMNRAGVQKRKNKSGKKKPWAVLKSYTSPC